MIAGAGKAYSQLSDTAAVPTLNLKKKFRQNILAEKE